MAPMTSAQPTEHELESLVRDAVGGSKTAAGATLARIQDQVYGLAMRMLGHPADAQDATQEILVIVLTNLGTFRGESRFRTWVWRVSVNYLMKVRKGRREHDSFEALADRIEAGLGYDADPDASILAQEVRLRCTQAMLLSLDRDHRIVYILAEIFQLDGHQGASILDLDPATFRKRLSRARGRLHAFMRARCGLVDEANPCRCDRQVAGAVASGRLIPSQLLFANHGHRGTTSLGAHVEGVDRLFRAAEVLRSHPDYATPEAVQLEIRAIIESRAVRLLDE